MDQREINKLTKKKSGLVIATIITIVLAIIFIAVSIGVNGNIKSYYQLELDGQAVSGEEAYINIVDLLKKNLKMAHMMIIILFLMTMIAHICFALIER